MSNKFPFDLTEEYLLSLLGAADENEKLFLYSIIANYITPSYVPDAARVEWDLNIIYAKLKKNISANITHWYDDTTTAGDSTRHAISAFSKYRLQPSYLTQSKKFDYSKTLTFYSKALGETKIKSPNPIFVAPYGAANLYGGLSDEMECAMGALAANVLYTIPTLTKYNIEALAAQSAQSTAKLFQLYLTADDDINISLIERAKQAGMFAIMVTIDAGAAHGGIPMIATGSDITFSTHISGNILSDVVFNIKCFEKLGCIGTMDKAIIAHISEMSKTSAEQIRSTYNKKKAFQFARRLQIGGMSKQNSCLDSAAGEYIWSLDHLAKICHSAQSMSKYVKYNFAKGVPIIAKGILSTRDAKAAIDCDVDCLYVSNHGGRFLQNSIATIDALPAIKSVAEGVNPNIGVWFDSGVRNAGDILVAYSRGADFVGIGRPVIYSCVVYGGIGVEAILKQLLFFLKQQCILCGVNNLDQAKDILAK